MPPIEALSTLAGAGIGSGGQIAGGILASKGGLNSGDLINSYFDPNTNLALQASQFDALNQLGFGNINNVPSPYEQLVGRIMALPVEERTKRRALQALQDGRESGAIGDVGFLDEVRRGGRLRGVLKRLGMVESDLARIDEEETKFATQRESLSDLSGLQTDTIRSRADSAAAAANLLGQASEFATSGQTQSPFQQSLLDRVNRGINDREEQFLLQSNFGGFTPGAGIEGFSRERADANITALEQALAASLGITNTLGGGLKAGFNASDQSVNAGTNAASISAQQAMAANTLRNATSLDNAQSLGQGIASGASAFGKGIANTGAIFGGGNFGGGGGGGTISNGFASPNFNVDQAFSGENIGNMLAQQRLAGR